MTTKEAMDHLVAVLKSDPDYREGWKANIAMAFKDQWAHRGMKEVSPQTVHDVANAAASAFLEQLAPTRKMPDLPGGLAVELTHAQV